MSRRPAPLPVEDQHAAASVWGRAAAIAKQVFESTQNAIAQTLSDRKIKQQAKADYQCEQAAMAAVREAAETAANQERNRGAAADALRFARSYLDDCYQDGASGSQRNDALKFASKYLKQARELNPNVGLTIETKDGLFTCTQDQLAAEALYLEGSLLSVGEHEPQLKNAFEALKKAAVYDPTAPHIHREIAQVLLKLHRRDDALKAAEFALSLNPSNIASRKLYDKIEATPSLGVKRQEASVVYEGLAKAFWGLAVIFCLVLPAMLLTQGHFVDAIISFIVLGMPSIGIAGKFSEWAIVSKFLRKAAEREIYKD